MRENVFRDRNLQKWQKRCILPSVVHIEVCDELFSAFQGCSADCLLQTRVFIYKVILGQQILFNIIVDYPVRYTIPLGAAYVIEH